MGYLRKALNWYARLRPGRGKASPPYTHVVQIGDPCLRRVSECVPVDKIKTPEIQNIIKKLNYVLLKHESVGMAAPQIGVNLKIFIMKFTEKQVLQIKEIIKSNDIEVVSYTVFINPEMKILDYKKVVHHEACESVKGYKAEVARYNSVLVSGWNENAEKHSQTYTGWGARIVQHEIDHLEGKLYTDVMDRKTLQCICWEDVNLSEGKVLLPFSA